MRRAKSDSAEIQRLRSVLLRKGMTTYPLAMQAIAEFRHEVFSILKRVADPRAKAIRQIVGNASIKPHSDAVDDFLDDPDTLLAVETNSSPCYFQLAVFWQHVNRLPGPVRISAAIFFEKRATFEKVDKALQDRFGAKVRTDADWGCYLEESIDPQQAGQLESALGKISDKWIKMLHTVNVRKLIRSKE